MRRSIWSGNLYAEVDHGEDQVARDIIDADIPRFMPPPTATVYHSHDYNPAQTYKRSKPKRVLYEHLKAILLANGHR
jgi:hypothetical protein